MVEDAIEDLIGLALEFKQPGNASVKNNNRSVFLDITNYHDKERKFAATKYFFYLNYQ
jgi:hypothetical protein